MDVSPSRSVRLKKGQRPHDSFLALVVKRLRAGTARNQILIRSHYAACVPPPRRRSHDGKVWSHRSDRNHSASVGT